jgi:hypothetical protein
MATSGLKLIFDENFSHKQVSFLHSESGLADMRHVRSMSWSSTPDATWIPLAVGMDMVIVSWDRNEQTRGFTVADLKYMNAREILFGPFWDNLGRWDKAKWLIAHIERLILIAEAMSHGSVVLVDRSCRVTQL